jgi:15-cis-phytoene desaturase
MAPSMAKTVAVLGGGVAGLSATHELVKRGYRVSVYEARPDLGGKARSQGVAGTGTGGRADLPGEHGFRFYPAFYKHLIQTMTEIPLGGAPGTGRTVADNLRACSEAGVAPDGMGLMEFLRRAPSDMVDVARVLDMFFGKLGVEPRDVVRFGQRILRYLSSCRERRSDAYENTSWWSYLGGDGYHPDFQRYLRAVPRIMVAMDPRRGSARTIGNISMQLMADYGKEGRHNDRTLIGPTTEAWIAPWRAHLESRGVTFHVGRRLVGLDFDPGAGRITGARVEGEPAPVEADFYVLAVPLESAVEMVTDSMARHDPELAKLAEIRERGLVDVSEVIEGDSPKMIDWMVGIQFFLREDVPLVGGHVFYPDSPWALSSISQAQFWNHSGGFFRERYGDGAVGGVLSIDVSDWNRAGVLFHKPAKQCTAEEIRREVWEQLKRGLNLPGKTLLEDAHLLSWNLDQDLHFPEGGPGAPVNRSPLLVHPPGSWRLRPTAETGVENLVLASDYVRTETNLACMEGANEAARLAVNAILRQDAYVGPACQLWPLEEDPMFDRVKKLDQIAYTRGRAALSQAVADWQPRGDAGADRIVGFLMDEPEIALSPEGLRGFQSEITGQVLPG